MLTEEELAKLHPAAGSIDRDKTVQLAVAKSLDITPLTQEEVNFLSDLQCWHDHDPSVENLRLKFKEIANAL